MFEYELPRPSRPTAIRNSPNRHTTVENICPSGTHECRLIKCASVVIIHRYRATRPRLQLDSLYGSTGCIPIQYYGHLRARAGWPAVSNVSTENSEKAQWVRDLENVFLSVWTSADCGQKMDDCECKIGQIKTKSWRENLKITLDFLSLKRGLNELRFYHRLTDSTDSPDRLSTLLSIRFYFFFFPLFSIWFHAVD